jgi:hypothetical protein
VLDASEISMTRTAHGRVRDGIPKPLETGDWFLSCASLVMIGPGTQRLIIERCVCIQSPSLTIVSLLEPRPRSLALTARRGLSAHDRFAEQSPWINRKYPHEHRRH